ncbi:MAG: ABC transporter permease [Microthrixaceae bacterium]
MSTPAQVWSYRTLIANLAQRELKSKYKRSFLGWSWSLINPAATLAIYTVVFGYFLKADPPEMGNGDKNFALYLFSGLVVWNLFSGIINTSISSFSGAGQLLTRTYFPPECPVVAGLLTVMIQAVLEFAILMFFMILVGNVGWQVVLILPIYLLLSCFGFGIGLVLGVANIRFRDVFYLVGIGMQVLFYATPIVYPLDIVPENAQRILELNPMTAYVYAMRQCVYSLDLPTTTNWLVMVLSAAVSLVGGWILFSRWAPKVIEEL